MRPLHVLAAPGPVADAAYRGTEGAPQAGAIAPGIAPTPAHDLVFHGGKTIADLAYVNLYLGGQAAWADSDVQAIDQAVAEAMTDPWLNNVMAQYFPAATISCRFLRSQVLADPPAPSYSQGDLEALAESLYSQAQLQAPDLGSTVFCFLLPPGAVLTDDPNPTQSGGAPPQHAVDSLHGLGGFHGSVHPQAMGGGQATVYYAVSVYSQLHPDGTRNGIPVFDAPWKNVAATVYHELQEARTDADVGDAIRAGNDPQAERFLGWVSAQGEECGDFPVFEANPLTEVFQEVALANGNTAPVQLQYSNYVHGPEGPIPRPHGAARKRRRRGLPGAPTP